MKDNPGTNNNFSVKYEGPLLIMGFARFAMYSGEGGP
jgi:hypothetical protein